MMESLASKRGAEKRICPPRFLRALIAVIVFSLMPQFVTAQSAQDRQREEQERERHAEQQARQQQAGDNRKQGDAFLIANKTKQGVITMPSGLQYKVLAEGTGPRPNANDTVLCNYRAMLISGKEFDSSSKPGNSASFPVSALIKGFTEALQLMPVGSKWQLFVPPDLAFGDRGAGDIGPNTTLIFEVELLSIKGQITGGSSTPNESAASAPTASLAEGDSSLYDAQLQRATALFKNNQMREAAEAASTLIQAYPNRWEGYGLAGAIEKAQDKLPEAKAAYERALSLAPESVKPQITQAIQRIEAQLGTR